MTASAEVPAALRREVRLLGETLGRVLIEAGGEELLHDVERLRRATIALRREPTEARRQHVLEVARSFAPERAEQVARAFTAYFQLVNLAEEHDRVRKSRELAREPEPLDDSLEAAVRDVGKRTLPALLERLEVTPVLTAHPTEARRRAVVETLWRIGALLERLDDPRLSRPEGEDVRRRLHEEVSALWHTDPLRRHRPEPLDEVRAAMALFDQTIFLAVPRVYRELDRSLSPNDVGARPPAFERAWLRFGSWIGGDRDGHAGVTHAVTSKTLEIQAEHVLRGLENAARRIGRSLAVSDLEVPPSAELLASLERDARAFPREIKGLHRRLPDAPHRWKLMLVAARLLATRTHGAGAYRGPSALLEDLRMLQRSLAGGGAARLAFGEVQHLIWQAETFGFHLASLEVRQHAGVHSRVLSELGVPVGDAAGLDRLATEGWGRRRPSGSRSHEAEEALATFRTMAELQARFGTQACTRYVVSFTSSAADVVAVEALARLAVPAGVPLELEVVPLFESRTDLRNAPRVLDELLALPGFRSRVEARGQRLEVMLGYSDSAKDAGMLAANLAIYRAEGELAAWARRNGIELTLFHGRGGALGRGGGPTNRAILGQAPGSVGGRFKLTEQGEITFARYGNLRVAQRHLEQVTHAVLIASTREHEKRARAVWNRFHRTAERMAAESERAYRALVGSEGFVGFFRHVTPMDEIEQLPLGSRPARRSREGGLEQLRAIPWVFAWGQTRCNLPGWFGLGSGLEAVASTLEGLGELRTMHREWPWFTSLMENAEMSLAKADLPVAQLYLELGEREDLASAIEEEFARTVRWVLEVTEHAELLEGRPLLKRAIDLRNPYVDALSFLQIEVLRKLRAGTGTDAERRLALITINGVAAGLQNTG